MNFYDLWFYSLLLTCMVIVMLFVVSCIFFYIRFENEKLKRDFERMLKRYLENRKID